MEVTMAKHESAVAACVIGVCGSVAWAATFQGVGDLAGGTETSKAYGVSGDGNVVVGESSSANGDEAFRWDAINGMIGLETGDGLDVLAGASYFSQAGDASADGAVIIGTIGNSAFTLGFRWDAVDGMQLIWPFPGEDFDCRPEGVSADGTIIVGTSSAGVNEGESFRWTEDTGITPLENNPASATFIATAISGDGLIVGGLGKNPAEPSVQKAFRWDAVAGPVALDPTLPGHFSGVTGASADGSVLVGYMEVYIGEFLYRNRAFRWTLADGIVDLGTVGNAVSDSLARAVNGDGTVIVGERTDSDSKAFIWREGVGMQYLATVVTSEYGLDLTGWTLTTATGVSGDGLVIVGWGKNPNGKNEGWIADLRAPVPTCAGDVTGDHATNSADFNVLASNFGNAVTPGTSGDLNNDGLVNSADFNILAGDFGCGTPEAVDPVLSSGMCRDCLGSRPCRAMLPSRPGRSQRLFAANFWRIR